MLRANKQWNKVKSGSQGDRYKANKGPSDSEQNHSINITS